MHVPDERRAGKCDTVDAGESNWLFSQYDTGGRISAGAGVEFGVYLRLSDPDLDSLSAPKGSEPELKHRASTIDKSILGCIITTFCAEICG